MRICADLPAVFENLAAASVTAKTMANVSVLLYVGERKRVVNIPSTSTDHLALLKQSVVDWTGEKVEYFERFESEWKEWIELEEKFQASDKDRIKAILCESLMDTDAKRNSSAEVLKLIL